MPKDEIKRIKNEIKGIGNVFAIILYGSHATGNANKRSDIDICVVLKTNDKEKIKEIYKKTLILSGKNEKCDIKIFELLPLKIKFEVINSGKIMYSQNLSELYEYFYFYRKLWQDQSVNWLKKKGLLS